MNGSGCKNCPVKNCETMHYRGSTCAAQRAKFGLGDPQTNADHIRAATDEELASFLDDITSQGCVCPTRDCRPTCHQCIVEWLQQPVESEAPE